MTRRSDPLVNLLRNGYRRNADGTFSKLIECPGPVTNHAVERVTRNVKGKIIKVETANQRRK